MIESLEAECQMAVVDSQLVQDGGVQVVDVHRVVLEAGRALAVWIDDVVAVFVGPAVLDAALDSASSQPGCETARMMIATVIFRCLLSLAIDGSSELA